MHEWLLFWNFTWEECRLFGLDLLKKLEFHYKGILKGFCILSCLEILRLDWLIFSVVLVNWTIRHGSVEADKNVDENWD
jgi:hypothetical protein